MNLTDKVTIPEQVMARQVGEETVILDLASGTYFANMKCRGMRSNGM